MEADSRIRLSREIAAADWIASRLGEEWGLCNSFMPLGFERYARILHPAEGPWGKLARWSEVAAWSGKELQADAEFELIERRTVGEGAGRTFGYEPRFGELSPELVERLVEILGRFTESPGPSWFCIWEGGWINGPGSIMVALGTPDGERAEIQATWEAAWQVPFGETPLSAARVRLPGRDYLLLEGPLEAVVEIGERRDWQGRSHFERHSPNLWWPDDRGWCVATEIDHQSTYVGGPDALIDELLADTRFETFEIGAADALSDNIDRSR